MTLRFEWKDPGRWAVFLLGHPESLSHPGPEREWLQGAGRYKLKILQAEWTSLVHRYMVGFITKIMFSRNTS